jgi:hypothetical protein
VRKQHKKLEFQMTGGIFTLKTNPGNLEGHYTQYAESIYASHHRNNTEVIQLPLVIDEKESKITKKTMRRMP